MYQVDWASVAGRSSLYSFIFCLSFLLPGGSWKIVLLLPHSVLKYFNFRCWQSKRHTGLLCCGSDCELCWITHNFYDFRTHKCPNHISITLGLVSVSRREQYLKCTVNRETSFGLKKIYTWIKYYISISKILVSFCLEPNCSVSPWFLSFGGGLKQNNKMLPIWFSFIVSFQLQRTPSAFKIQWKTSLFFFNQELVVSGFGQIKSQIVPIHCSDLILL